MYVRFNARGPDDTVRVVRGRVSHERTEFPRVYLSRKHTTVTGKTMCAWNVRARYRNFVGQTLERSSPGAITKRTSLKTPDGVFSVFRLFRTHARRVIGFPRPPARRSFAGNAWENAVSCTRVRRPSVTREKSAGRVFWYFVRNACANVVSVPICRVCARARARRWYVIGGGMRCWKLKLCF